MTRRTAEWPPGDWPDPTLADLFLECTTGHGATHIVEYSQPVYIGAPPGPAPEWDIIDPIAGRQAGATWVRPGLRMRDEPILQAAWMGALDTRETFEREINRRLRRGLSLLDRAEEATDPTRRAQYVEGIFAELAPLTEIPRYIPNLPGRAMSEARIAADALDLAGIRSAFDGCLGDDPPPRDPHRPPKPWAHGIVERLRTSDVAVFLCARCVAFVLRACCDGDYDGAEVNRIIARLGLSTFSNAK